ncbi:beta-1,3-galactosyltransferase 5-like [Ostrea edulis]|uniref:beta-1,3-galactosyltransferase 5-like n=1 Tax=Ostrea edulis TaxID=37623 RepID=UPI0020943282|nr:beta-1,3-galactosyltransferase 5-like [Ostrea edulis]
MRIRRKRLSIKLLTVVGTFFVIMILRYSLTPDSINPNSITPDPHYEYDLDDFQRHLENGSISYDGTIRSRTCNSCFNISYKVLMDDINTCKNHQSMKVVLFITTTATAIERRTVLRHTWLSVSKNNTSNVRYAFVIGGVPDSEVRESIQLENEFYKDILQGEFLDVYHTLTIKTMMALNWATKHCPQDVYVMKTDDDVFINMPALLNVIDNHHPELQHSVIGCCYKDWVNKPNRNKTTKYYVSYAEYPWERLTAFCSGTGYLTSMTVVKQVCAISKNIPFFHLEDVYFSFCVRELNLSFIDVRGFGIELYQEDLCYYRSPEVVLLHNTLKNTSFLIDIWHMPC